MYSTKIGTRAHRLMLWRVFNWVGMEKKTPLQERNSVLIDVVNAHIIL